jgi:hypothetical protein
VTLLSVSCENLIFTWIGSPTTLVGDPIHLKDTPLALVSERLLVTVEREKGINYSKCIMS